MSTYKHSTVPTRTYKCLFIFVTNNNRIERNDTDVMYGRHTEIVIHSSDTTLLLQYRLSTLYCTGTYRYGTGNIFSYVAYERTSRIRLFPI